MIENYETNAKRFDSPELRLLKYFISKHMGHFIRSFMTIPGNMWRNDDIGTGKQPVKPRLFFLFISPQLFIFQYIQRSTRNFIFLNCIDDSFRISYPAPGCIQEKRPPL